MNEAVQKRKKYMLGMAKDIMSRADRLIDEIEDLESSDDLYVIEMGFDQIESWGREGYEVCRNTYDEFEEEEK